jgi:hypothetical protein
MTRRRLLRARSVWIAALAAFCVLAFGGSPHSTAAGAFAASTTNSASATVGYTYSNFSGLHTDSELLTRSLAGPATAVHVFTSHAGLAGFAIALLLGSWLLFARRSPSGRRLLRLHGPRPGRAPPLVS